MPFLLLILIVLIIIFLILLLIVLLLFRGRVWLPRSTLLLTPLDA